MLIRFNDGASFIIPIWSERAAATCDMILNKSKGTMKRPANQMPEFVRAALKAHGLRVRYDARPWYQRNDYLGWIGRAKREETRLKRLGQMLEELKAGDVYMKMPWRKRQ